MSVWGRMASALAWVERALIGCLLAAMLALTTGQIILRNFFDTGFVWADPAARVLVLWLGLLGAVAATRGGRHIAIDVLPRALEGLALKCLLTGIHVVTAAVCALISWHAFRLVRMDYVDGLTGFSGMPSWLLESVIPVAFLVIALRALAQLPCVYRGETPESGTEAASWR